MNYLGIDLRKRESQVAVVDQDGEIDREVHVEKTENTIQRLSSRLVAVAEKRLNSLRNTGMITLETFSVLVDVRVICGDCDTHTDVRTLLNDSGCDWDVEP